MNPRPRIALVIPAARRLGGALMMLLAALGQPAAAAPPAAMVVIAPQQPAPAGEAAVFTIYFTNSEDAPVSADIPQRLPVTLSIGNHASAATLVAVDAPPTILLPAGGHGSVAYRVDIPSGADGPATLHLLDPAVDIRFLVQAAAGPKIPDTAAAELSQRPDHLADNFYGYEPIYFLYGPNPDHAKYQISFKYRIINPDGPLARRWHQASNLYFGYTQTSFWDWAAASAPFFDSSYKPALFYFEPGISQTWLPIIGDVDLQTGLLHESNGRDGAASRSFNIAFIKPRIYLGDREKAHFTLAPRVWAYLGDMADNPDIARYRGYADIEGTFDIPDSLKLAVLLRKGTDAGKASVQIDATYPLSKLFLGNLDIYAQIQYFSGYGETLLRYNQAHSYLRFGFAVYR